jgi:AmmeMemoRadiSam system protein B
LASLYLVVVLAEQLVQTISRSPKIRPPAVAGLFYAGNAQELQADIAEFFANVPAIEAAPKALIAPHAGYIYSGQVAAAAFACVKSSAVTRVVLIGPAHYVRLHGIAVPAADAFDTPLGRVPVDRDARAAVLDLPFVSQSDGPHASEHALEVELPFLQTVLGAFAVVPLLVGDATPQQVGEALGRLWGGADTLIVVSSDLSHYLDYDTACRRDAATAAAIESGDCSSLGPSDACGFLPIAGLLTETVRRGLNARRLALCNSGDTAGSRDSVVGYGAWIFEHASAA